MISNLATKLQEKAALKAAVFKLTQSAFKRLEMQAHQLAQELHAQVKLDAGVQVQFDQVNAHEFILRFGEDALVVILQSNVVKLPEERYLSKAKYVKADDKRAYFGQILVYNFLSDTITYNRMEDHGYLIGRLLLNIENKFFIEGERNLVFHYPELKENDLTDEKLRDMLMLLMRSAVDNDLLAPAFQELMVINYQQKLLYTSGLGSPQKIGFDVFAKNREEEA
ncbi:hypothetical protein A3SI_16852 [Nitritalea halalkaliphila LW7]|uniref:Uncharacterized protein n=1 Tax=Nitritalea halalkaliphila LW7 TaxID=1189621 RepID=I5BWG0_9BACT|nr:hypothetical protein [Nitritalea halalkaliphila]EIM73912.1 hypothetical protein A3SI_16852 [Nitritalea halalkaliphila LW7]